MRVYNNVFAKYFENTAIAGGAVYITSKESANSYPIFQGDFESNTARTNYSGYDILEYGGAFCIDSPVQFELMDSIVFDNRAGYGGALVSSQIITNGKVCEL